MWLFAMLLILFIDYIFKETPCNNCILIILCYVAMSLQGEIKKYQSAQTLGSQRWEQKKVQLPICMMWCKLNGYHSSTLEGKSLKVWQTRFLNIP